MDKWFGNVDLKSMKTMEQPTMNQIIMKNINTLTLYNKVLPTTKGDEFNLPFICCFFFLFFSFFFLFAFVFFFKYLFFSSFSLFGKKWTRKT